MFSKSKIMLILFLLPASLTAQNLTFSVQHFLSATPHPFSTNPWGIFKFERTTGIRLNSDLNFYKNFSFRAGFSYLDGTLTTYRYSQNFTGDLKEYSADLGIVWQFNFASFTPMLGFGITHYFYSRSIDQSIIDLYRDVYNSRDVKETVGNTNTPFVSLGFKADLFDKIFYLFEIRFNRATFNISRTYISNYDNKYHEINYEENFNRIFYGFGVGIAF